MKKKRKILKRTKNNQQQVDSKTLSSSGIEKKKENLHGRLIITKIGICLGKDIFHIYPTHTYINKEDII